MYIPVRPQNTMDYKENNKWRDVSRSINRTPLHYKTSYNEVKEIQKS